MGRRELIYKAVSIILNDFEMIIKKFPKNDDIIILPISDVHLGALEHMTREWEMFVSKVLDRPNIYLTLGGDLLDNATKTSIASPWDNTMRPAEQKKVMAAMLEPIKDRVLCIIPGNHCGRNRDVDDEPMYDIACKLDIEDVYRPNMAFVKIQIGSQNGDGTRNPTYMLCVAHGAGSSIYVGGAASKGERFGMAIEGLDCLITGHTHKPADLPNAKIHIDKQNNKISVKPWRHLVCSSWLGYADYAARKLLPPTAYAEQKLILHGKEKAIEIAQITR